MNWVVSISSSKQSYPELLYNMEGFIVKKMDQESQQKKNENLVE